jgi:hypothetical protein
VAIALENGDDVIVVAHGLEIHDQRPVSLDPQRRRGKQCAVEALRPALP